MQEMLAFLNSNSSAVVATATLMTAAATVCIAVFSWGTWKLYKLEKKKVESAEIPVRHAMAGLTGSLAVPSEMLDAYLSLSESERTETALFVTLLSVRAVAEEIDQRLEAMMEAGPYTSPELTRTVSGARATLWGVRDFLPELTTEYTSDVREHLERVYELLEEMREDFRSHAGMTEEKRTTQGIWREALRSFSSDSATGELPE